MAKPDLMDFDKALELYEPVLGFEVHVELSTQTKMFSDAPNPAAAGAPASAAAEHDDHPRRPRPAGLASRSSTRRPSSTRSASASRSAARSRRPATFARKNYFYPDLAKNYQISQYDEPIAFEGSVEVELEDGTLISVPIERAHMEEDAGKLTHVGGATGRIQGAEYSLVDYNRAGVPLVEIVTKPIFGAEHKAPESARRTWGRSATSCAPSASARRAWSAATSAATRTCRLRPRGQEKLGTRTETKNVNSMRSVERAVRYEIQRQAAILAKGGTITQETRHWHEDTGTTSAGRPKSDADDYRYFPEPDLLPIEPSAELIEKLRAALPEAPGRAPSPPARGVGLHRPGVPRRA